MKKIIWVMWVLLVLSILAGCYGQTLKLDKIENIPQSVQNNVDTGLRLQAITDGGKGYYIIFYSSEEVEGDLELQEDTVTIRLNETNASNNEITQHSFYLTADTEYDAMQVLVNDEFIPFEAVTVQ